MRSYRTYFLLTILLLLTQICSTINAALLDSANNFYKDGKLKEAISLYKKAADEGENPSMCYFNCANAYFQTDSLPQSIVYYKLSIRYAPDFFRNHLNLAVAYYSLDDMGECIASISRALEIDPENQKAQIILAAAYRSAGSIPLAIITFEKLMMKYPEYDEGYIALGEMYRELSDDQNAIEWFKTYPESGKNETYVFQILSDIYEKNNNLESALYYSRSAFEKDPKNRWLYHKICRLTLDMGNDLVALDEAIRGMDLFPDFSDLAIFAGNIAMKHDKLDEAERLFSIADKYGHPSAVIGLDNIRKLRLASSETQ